MLAQGRIAHRRNVQVETRGDLVHNRRNAACLVKDVHRILAAGLDVGDKGRVPAQCFERVHAYGPLQVQLFKEGQEVHHRVGGSGNGVQHADRVLDRAHRHDL